MKNQERERINSEYVTVVDDDGENYREIAAIMTELGHPMNHSSARNYVLRIMKKFAQAYSDEFCRSSDEEDISRIAKDPSFQLVVADVLHCIETSERR